jgi:chromatin structure-remodeling complex subunit RSC4
MIGNAKFYNVKSSLIFADAERIRKILKASMTKLNPAYKDPNYVPFPTPLPTATEEASRNETSKKSLNGHTAGSTPAAEDGEKANNGFGSDTFQNAQERIVNEMIALKDEE